jgi:hypothetical protein
MEFFHFMQGFLSSGMLGFHCTKNTDVLPISQSRRKMIREMQIKFEKEGIL